MTSDRLALVTGTSAGIGAAVAARLVDNGWTVVGVARRAGAVADSRYRHLSLDLADLASLTRIEAELTPMLRDAAVGRFGLVNNAASPGPLAPLGDVDPGELATLYTVNVIAPMALMGLFVRHVHASATLRVVNVSSGAAVAAFPGLGPYSGSKAALRMAGMVLGAELGSPKQKRPPPRDAAILSYQPGIVETGMQAHARSLSPEVFPWVDLFHGFAARGLTVPPAAPAGEIVRFLESDGHPLFSEARLTGS
jgi:benzil reductase ((S)-benzoin forming)